MGFGRRNYGVPTVAQVRMWVGFDVHATKVVAAIADAESGELRIQRLGGKTKRVVGLCKEMPAPVRVGYESGPTGFALARELERAGISCVIAAPGKIERPAQDRVKTDRRDAERLVRLLMIGGIHPVWVPTPGEEAMRDLTRAREDIRGDLMRARHRVAKLLLRGQQLDRGPPPVALGPRALRAGRPVGPRRWGRVDRRDARAPLRPRGPDERPGPIISVGRGGGEAQMPARHRHSLSTRPLRRDRRLRALSAPRSADELPRPGSLREHKRGEASPGIDHQVGLAPCPAPAGRGRLALPPGAAQGQRADAPPTVATAAVCAISWKAQQRLHRTWRRLDSERGKRRTICAVAVAREFSGFCWAVAQAD